MTSPASEEKPKPCPFCGMALTRRDEGLNYRHPNNDDCFVGGHLIPLDRLDQWNQRVDDTPATMAEEPTDGQLVNACLSYNHGYGLMTPEQRDRLHFQCREWWRSIARAIVPTGDRT